MVKKIWSERFKHVYSYTNKKGVFWGYRYPYYNALGNRVEASKAGIKTEKEAYAELIEVMNEVENGNVSLLDNKNMTVESWSKQWFDFYKDSWSPSTLQNTDQAIKKAIIPKLGKLKYSKLDKITYKKLFIDPLLEIYKPATVRLYHRRFMTMTNAAVEHEKLDRNRLSGVKLPTEEKIVKAFTKDELKLFNQQLKKESLVNNTMFSLILSTGMRIGEVLGLTWSDIDFDTRKIDINKSRNANGLGKTKTYTSKRTITVHQNIINLLKQLKLASKFTKQMDYIFYNEYSNPYSPVNARYAFDKIISTINKQHEHTVIRNITIHGLRHTHATFLLAEGADAKYVSERLGHRKITTTLDTYTHLLKNKEEETADMFENILDSL
ncbi:tyrosine-type recombinase/integrase [Enterococcus sp. UD-01]|jgi:integrase|uniref:tyrosine-type recombinase/integrase n=1 Tax=Enterococcus sp. UD-01 TaxID=3373911 RepID=UPI003838AC75